MPELPEVETIRLGLKKYLVGKNIEEIDVRFEKLFQGDKNAILNAEIKEVRRFGKGLVIDFANGYSLAVHVKMTGQFVYKGKETQANFHPTLGVVGQLPNKWTHVIFSLSEDTVLFYNDIRKFGWMKVIKTRDIHSLPFFSALGPEPFAGLTLPLFRKILLHSTMPIKSLLMDQKKIGGVGNIYANEALFLAKLHPTRSANNLSKKEQERLYISLLEVLKRGLRYGGASDVNYINVEGTKGSYQQYFLIYRKHGKPCSECGTIITRSVVGGRGTFFCSECQV